MALDIQLHDWLKIAAFGISLLTTWWAMRRGPRIVYYLLHANSHEIPIQQGAPAQVNTHVLMIHNLGKTTAKNVKIIHQFLPTEVTISVWPPTAIQRNTLPQGAGEIVIGNVVPKKQITVSYIYPGGINVGQIGAMVESDEGMGERVPVQQSRITPTWQRRIFLWLIFVGLAFHIYVLMRLTFFLLGWTPLNLA